MVPAIATACFAVHHPHVTAQTIYTLAGRGDVVRAHAGIAGTGHMSQLRHAAFNYFFFCHVITATMSITTPIAIKMSPTAFIHICQPIDRVDCFRHFPNIRFGHRFNPSQPLRNLHLQGHDVPAAVEPARQAKPDNAAREKPIGPVGSTNAAAVDSRLHISRPRLLDISTPRLLDDCDSPLTGASRRAHSSPSTGSNRRGSASCPWPSWT
jgi:hypothetical protein